MVFLQGRVPACAEIRHSLSARLCPRLDVRSKQNVDNVGRAVVFVAGSGALLVSRDGTGSR